MVRPPERPPLVTVARRESCADHCWVIPHAWYNAAVHACSTAEPFAPRKPEQIVEPERLPWWQFNGHTVGTVFGDSGRFVMVRRPVNLAVMHEERWMNRNT